MQTKFKRHQKVRLLVDPDPEYVEYHIEVSPDVKEESPIKKGSIGKINMLLSNGRYHVEIIDPATEETIAYVPLDEDSIESID